MTNFIAGPILAVLVCLATGCAPSKIDELPIVDGEHVPVRQTINVGRVMSPGVHLIQSVDDFVQLTGQSSESVSHAFQSVDFSRETVVIAALGERNTTGYSIRIVGIALRKGVLNVYLRECSPSGTGPVGMVMTYPTHAIVVSKLPDAVDVVPIKLTDE
ncbi:protease complex subunit PrcB family protein [Rhodopirellula bahusiensis]|uniref:protease complex subunit PrcB family protein n=1 Tax=Rhodopirellula bahusiensis TaxID=2014065 RepID=UPI0032647798